MKKLLFFSLALALSASASPVPLLACVNDYVPNTKAIEASESLVQELTHVELKEPWIVRRDRLRKEVENGGDYKTRNDLASALMHTGDAKAAIEILEEIEKTNPGLYQTASNLGTAYELAGDNAKALEWIHVGIKRNPQSHEGSEWLHVKILEAKVSEKQLAASSEPNWTNTGSLLGLDFKQSAQRTVPNNLPKGNSGKPLTLDEVQAALKYQLHERLQFVKPTNQIVASLLFDLGTIIANKPEGPGMAQGIYELAAAYAEDGTPSSERIHHRILNKAFSARLANRTYSFFANRPLSFGSTAIIAVIAFYIFTKIRDFRRSRRKVTLHSDSHFRT